VAAFNPRIKYTKSIGQPVPEIAYCRTIPCLALLII